METLTIFAGFLAAWMMDPVILIGAAVAGLLTPSWRWAAGAGAGVGVAALGLLIALKAPVRPETGPILAIAILTAPIILALALQAVRGLIRKGSQDPRRFPQSGDSSS